MTDLINSLKTLAYSGTIGYDRRNSSGQLRIIPLLNLGIGKQDEDPGFTQWRDAMRMVARLPGGLPTEFRLKLWENLSEKYLSIKGITWSRIITKSATPTLRDAEIGDQIHKDLHRTGCIGFSGAKQAKLKSVLVAYARWNPSVGYCQGFNMIGAMLLEMTQGDETLTLKVLIFLIEGVLPEGYFSGGLRGLAVDMAVFRDILRMRKPTLHSQLCRLQGGEEQPPLIDVFTMHWFLTLFIHCLPTNSVLRIWDLVFLEGSEVLLRTALVLWAAVEPRILEVKSADEFYSVMGVVTREMLEFGLMDPNSLVKCIVSVGPFPLPGLDDLRQRHRTLVQQDTPYKSFFLAKRELDNLKKHYAAIRHRQKATTIILKGLEASRMKVPGGGGQRSNSLFIPTTKKQVVSGTRSTGGMSNGKVRRQSSGGTSGISLAVNKTNNTNNNVSNNNRVRNNNAKNTGIGSSANTFRRRRTLSTSSSSSTELCDSSEDGDSSEGVWSDSDNKWVKKKEQKKMGVSHQDSTKENEAPQQQQNKGHKKVENEDEKNKEKPKSIDSWDFVFDNEEKEKQEKSPISSSLLSPVIHPEEDGDPGNKQAISRSSSIIDTNDSHHFLEEMTKLGKSDSFYENLSKRICELQFQNLKTLSSCQTVIDPNSLKLPPFPKSPVCSPMSPFPPTSPNSNNNNNSGTLSPRRPMDSGNATPRRSSKSSVSSLDIPDICVENEKEKKDREKHHSGPGCVSPSDLGLAPSISSSPRPQPILQFPESASISGDKELLSPLLTHPASPQKSKSPEDRDEDALVSPRSPNMSIKKKLGLDTTMKEEEIKTQEEEDKAIFLFEPLSTSKSSSNGYGDSGHGEEDEEEEEEMSPQFPTTLCPGQYSDLPSDEQMKINAVIRENIAILQRLKLNKTTYMEGEDEEDDEYESYEDVTDDNEEEEESEDDKGNKRGRRGRLESLGSEDRDSGAPLSSSKGSLTTTKERLSSVSSNTSSNTSLNNIPSSGGGRRRSSSGGSIAAGRRPGPGLLQRQNSKGSISITSSTTTNGTPVSGFNPFPTARKARLRVTKYGLYN